MDALSDAATDYSDIPELDDTFFKKAVLEMPRQKERVTIRLDHEVLAWFKQQGKGYQTKINAILKTYVKTH